LFYCFSGADVLNHLQLSGANSIGAQQQRLPRNTITSSHHRLPGYKDATAPGKGKIIFYYYYYLFFLQ
jgi:hypothetical protein